MEIPHHAGQFLFHDRLDEFAVYVAVDIDLFVVQGLHDFTGHEGFIDEIGFNRRKTDLCRIVTQGDQAHGFVQAVGGPFQLLDVVKSLHCAKSI